MSKWIQVLNYVLLYLKDVYRSSLFSVLIFYENFVFVFCNVHLPSDCQQIFFSGGIFVGVFVWSKFKSLVYKLWWPCYHLSPIDSLLTMATFPLLLHRSNSSSRGTRPAPQEKASRGAGCSQAGAEAVACTQQKVPAQWELCKCSDKIPSAPLGKDRVQTLKGVQDFGAQVYVEIMERGCSYIFFQGHVNAPCDHTETRDFAQESRKKYIVLKVTNWFVCKIFGWSVVSLNLHMILNMFLGF
jgi:hypothetical protein